MDEDVKVEEDLILNDKLSSKNAVKITNLTKIYDFSRCKCCISIICLTNLCSPMLWKMSVHTSIHCSERFVLGH